MILAEVVIGIEDQEGTEADCTAEKYTKILTEVLNDIGLEMRFRVIKINSLEYDEDGPDEFDDEIDEDEEDINGNK